MTKKDKNMKRQKRNELRAAGFKPVPLSDWWVNGAGETYNQRTGRISRPRFIKTNGGGFCIEKAVLWMFAGIPPRGGQITYIDGNKENKTVENLKYTSAVTLPHETVNRENLCHGNTLFFQH